MEKTIVVPVELWVFPLRVADQSVPPGRPVSLKLTAYVTAVYAIVGSSIPAPLTPTLPANGRVDWCHPAIALRLYG